MKFYYQWFGVGNFIFLMQGLYSDIQAWGSFICKSLTTSRREVGLCVSSAWIWARFSHIAALEMMCDLPRLCHKRWWIFCISCWSTQTGGLSHQVRNFITLLLPLCVRPLHLERPDVVHRDSAEVTGVKPAPVARYMHESGSKWFQHTTIQSPQAIRCSPGEGPGTVEKRQAILPVPVETHNPWSYEHD